jgi:hypothetical protein
MRQIGHFIDGELVPGTSGRTKDIFNPNTGDVQAQVALACGDGATVLPHGLTIRPCRSLDDEN